jgi:hydrogenase maturation protease
MAEFDLNDEQSFSNQNSSAHPLIMIFGLGNPLLGDDGVGWAIAREVRSRLAIIQNDLEAKRNFRVEVDSLSLGGLSLMERLAGCQKAILIDSIVTGNHPLGTVLQFALEELPAADIGHLSSAHDVSLQTALEVGRSMGVELPQKIMIVAVESQFIYEFSENLSPPVAAAIPEAASLVLDLLDQTNTE